MNIHQLTVFSFIIKKITTTQKPILSNVNLPDRIFYENIINVNYNFT